jgi:hypothetical protein
MLMIWKWKWRQKILLTIEERSLDYKIKVKKNDAGLGHNPSTKFRHYGSAVGCSFQTVNTTNWAVEKEASMNSLFKINLAVVCSLVNHEFLCCKHRQYRSNW